MQKERFKLISAVHIFFVKDNKILLLRRLNTGYEDGKYSVPAGHLDGNEEVKKAGIREVKEEVGVDIHENDIKVVGVMHRKSNDERIDFFLEAIKWDGEIGNMEPHKCSELAWFHIDELPNNTIEYVRRAIENYKKKNYFDSFGW